ncbi:hydantoinase/oxoprolinase family protein [Paucidesulfovibrio longus]|uniref:hydantoinase/oxoprolinase family protein n=1 Tax=Paucidesulfovibrio longus TaxID=889 RepID=UPI0003B6BC5F|nr:hydantoinase/oxoprolinase family protein [Paucidesulfovibrio longus]
MAIVGADTGGTFTDLILLENGKIRVHKLLSTPHDPAEAILAGLDALDAGLDADVVHGSTVATNAVLERKGAVTALVTNAGFEDVLLIGRQNRTDLYDLHYRRSPGIVPEHLRFGIPGRVASTGEEVEPFDDDAARRAAEAVRESGAESVAVCLLFSFLAPAHELRMAEILRETCPGATLSLSHRVLAEFREYERTATTTINAYVAPRMNRYLANLRAAVPAGLRIMQSNGGTISAATAAEEPVRTVLSGPAGGVVGALAVGRAAGFDRLMTFDMGGTSTDVALLDNGLPLATGTTLSGYPVRTPMIDIHTVGAGGGSIASLDAGGSLVVGPQSAGADPGPVCYGKGGRVTVTDANLFLGRLSAEHFLGGRMRLDAERTRRAVERMAREAGLAPTALAEGILQVADSNMERALRVISVERGFDPGEFTLLSFGGAGGLHCSSLARLLGVPRVLVPNNPGLLSALGMLMADVVKDYSLTVMHDAADLAPAALERAFAPLEARALDEMALEGFQAGQVRLERALDMRYAGQSFELTTPLEPDRAPAETFAELHERAYGHRMTGRAVQVVTLRLRAVGPAAVAPPAPRREGPPKVAAAARKGFVQAVFEGREHETPVLDRDQLLPGNAFAGPALVVEYSSTVAVPPWARAEVDACGNLLLFVS